MNQRRRPRDSGAKRVLNDRREYYFTPESRLFFSYIARSAALSWPMNGPALLVLVAAAALAFGFFAWPLAKAAEVETARIATPTKMIFFMFGSLEKDATSVNHNLLTSVKNHASGSTTR